MASLEYRLVQIVGQEPLDPTPEQLELNPQATPLVLDGKIGQSLGFDEERRKYAVVTFDSDVVEIDEANLRAYEPPPPEEGGFDLAFPASEDTFQFFADELGETLQQKRYCVIQMSSRPMDRLSAQRAVSLSDEEKWTRIMPEFENQYMGRSPHGKKVQWPDIEEDSGNGLEVAEATLAAMAIAVSPVCPSLGFEGVSRTNGMLHMNCASRDEEEELLDRFKGDAKMVGAKTIQYNLTFSQRKKISLLYFVNGSGGSLTLHPANRGAEEITLPCNENQAIVFRHDLCDYTFAPHGDQVALQSWILRASQTGEVQLQVTRESLLEDYETMPRAPGYGNSEHTVDCMSLACKLPGNVWDPDGYWNVVGNGVDCLLMIPYTRWDVDIYFSSNADAMPPGKCYCKHFGILTYEQMSEFDNEFFGMNLDESQKIEPPARNILEVGYECLFRAGYTRERLRGVELGCCYGFAAAELSQNYIQGHFGFEAETQTLTNSGICGARLHYVYGMKGPAATVETACSSSLYATAIVHSQLRPQMPSGGASRASSCRIQVEQGMAAGSNGYFDPWFTMSLCSAHMLSTTGRCYTFNSSADGYARGEGCPTMYYRRGRGEDPARLAVICGSCMNQDGRSASMTAPNGPSQQECIRHSLREAGIVALDIQIQELHGTGTSLGDPIEVGALRATMMTVDGEVREHPLVKTSSKSNVGHTELAAGICGIMKCVLMGIKCASSPNCHLKLLNPHIDSNSYPVYFGSEFVDQGRNEGFHGVSSFGFSGCNARGDIWARAMGGPRNTMPGKPPIDFSPARIFTCRALFSSNSQPPYAKEVEEIEGLDPVLNDAYLTETPHDDDNTFYCRGTFTGRTMEPMVWQEESNAYCFAFTMGETRIEQFHIIVNKNTNYTIFPATKMAGEDALTLGPGIAPTAHKWKIDGFKAGIKQGTVCAIKFIWDEATRQKKIVWGPCDEDWALDMAAESSFRHGFSLVCSCNAEKPTSFAQVKGKPGLYEATFRIGLSGFEDFSLMRDADPLQAIYPPGQGVTTAGVPICGPDHLGDNKKKWRAIGSTGERAVVQLQVTDGTISMTMRSQASGVLTWSNEDALGHYYVTASWNNWSFTPMVPDPSNSSIYRLSAAITQERLESFQIVVDQDKRQALHPEIQMADSGQSPVCGPDGKGGHLQFGIFGAPGQAFEITLDLSQEDKRNIVTWTEASSAALKDS